MKKKVVATLLAAVMAITTMTVGTMTVFAEGEYTRADEEGVVVGVLADPENMGPWSGMSQGRIAVLFSTYEYMITREDGVAYGVLAKSWDQVDGKTYDVEIYDYIHDTAGNPLTASDIVFSFETAIATKNYGKLEVIESVTAVDDYHVQFKFNKDLEIGEFENVMLECAIVTQAAYEASEDQMATTPVGTTAYKVESYVPGSSLTLVDTGDYWQTDESLVHGTSIHNAPKITFSVITEASQHTVALQTHAVDISNGVPDTDIDKFREGGEYSEGNEVGVVMDNLTIGVEYNMSDDSFLKDDQNLRLAIAYAIDSEGINLGAFNGNGMAVKDFANATYPDYNPEWDNEDYYDYDVDKAKEYLAASNYDGQTVRIQYITSTSMDAIAQMVQAYLGQIGITAELTGYDQMMGQQMQYDSTSYDILLKQSGSTDYIVNQWKLCWDRRDYESLTGGTANFVQDEKLDELMQACLNTETYGPESIEAMHDYLVEQCYGYGVVEGPINIVHSGYITDVALDIRNQILPGACEYAE
ncbi:ABC transporter substrate-binding protein [Ruminococcus sp. 5_1_39BFAA]|uniref:ABC transporter substrate-binding protein n=1 Tax=Ruminococcus sp. 5_1_39BFAA TaxID=457412 RepID=UPI003565DD13